jgi:hypothetical protein
MAATNQLTDAFKAMLVREFYMEPGLAGEFKAGWWLSFVARRSVRPASKILAANLYIPPVLVEKPIRAVVGEKHMALPMRAFPDWLLRQKSDDDNYRSCCRSALCYAINGSHEWAFGALRIAASQHDDWSRHHHIYGLIHGVEGNNERAVVELRLAERAEPYEDGRRRLAEAIALTDVEGYGRLSSLPLQETSLSKTMIEQLPELIQLILKVMTEVRKE